MKLAQVHARMACWKGLIGHRRHFERVCPCIITRSGCQNLLALLEEDVATRLLVGRSRCGSIRDFWAVKSKMAQV